MVRVRWCNRVTYINATCTRYETVLIFRFQVEIKHEDHPHELIHSDDRVIIFIKRDGIVCRVPRVG